MSSFTDTISDTAKETAARAAKVAGKTGKTVSTGFTSGYSQALDFAMTGLKLIPTVTAALGFLGLQKKQSNVLGNSASFGAGLLLGAGAGMLFAPKSGSELRSSLRDYFAGTPLENAAEKVSKKAEAVAHNVNDKVESVKSEVKAATHNGSRTVS